MRGMLVLIAASLGLLGASDASAPPCSVAGQDEEATRWRYATVRVTSKTWEPETLSFSADGELLQVDGWVALFAKLASERGLLRADEFAGKAAVLDYLGGQGWELVGFSTRSVANYEGETVGACDELVFKRRCTGTGGDDAQLHDYKLQQRGDTGSGGTGRDKPAGR